MSHNGGSSSSPERNPLLSRSPRSIGQLQSHRYIHRFRWYTPLCVGVLLLSFYKLVTHPHDDDSIAALPLTHSIQKAVVFAAIGDWGRRGSFHQNGTARALASVIPGDTAMVISVGDNFYDRGVKSVMDSHFVESFQRVYSHPKLRNVPWYLALGNHDHHGSTRAQILYSNISPLWNMPARYFALRIAPNLLIIFLDTTPLSDSHAGSEARKHPYIKPDQQLLWLQYILATSPRTTRFLIIGHHNMYSSSVAGHKGVLSVRDKVEPLLVPFSTRIVAYIAGHEHSLMHLHPYGQPGLTPLSNIEHFVTGAGSKLRQIEYSPISTEEYWRKCCGVLALSRNESVPRTVWAESVNGFFIFRIENDTFYASAYNESADVIYQYRRLLAPL